MSNHFFMRTGTLGGTITVMLANIASTEILKTAILAAVGASVSYTVSLGLKWLINKIRLQSNENIKG